MAEQFVVVVREARRELLAALDRLQDCLEIASGHDEDARIVELVLTPHGYYQLLRAIGSEHPGAPHPVVESETVWAHSVAMPKIIMIQRPLRPVPVRIRVEVPK